MLKNTDTILMWVYILRVFLITYWTPLVIEKFVVNYCLENIVPNTNCTDRHTIDLHFILVAYWYMYNHIRRPLALMTSQHYLKVTMSLCIFHMHEFRPYILAVTEEFAYIVRNTKHGLLYPMCMSIWTNTSRNLSEFSLFVTLYRGLSTAAVEIRPEIV